MSEYKETYLGSIPTDWNLVTTSVFCEKVTDGTHDSPKQQLSGKYLITSKHIKGRHIDFINAYLISNADYEKINQRSKVDQWDVIVSMIGEYCGFSYVERNYEVDYAVKNVGIFKVGNKEKALWLHYFLQAPIGKTVLESSRGGTSQPYIALGALRKLPVLTPKTDEEQNAIVAVISSLDDKIDLLHRQNKTLEAMAETLFHLWFAGDAGEDWEEAILDNVISVKGGTTPSTKEPEYWDGNIHWTTPRDLSNHNAVFLFDTERKITEKGLAQIGSGLLPTGTVLLSSRAPIGYLAISDIPISINQGYIAIVCDKRVSNCFMYLWCKENMNDIKSAGNGSVFDEISKSNFKALGLRVPPIEFLKDFDETVVPTFEKIRTNKKQIRTLDKLRDTLLPKLMSGEVRVAY